MPVMGPTLRVLAYAFLLAALVLLGLGIFFRYRADRNGIDYLTWSRYNTAGDYVGAAAGILSFLGGVASILAAVIR